MKTDSIKIKYGGRHLKMQVKDGFIQVTAPKGFSEDLIFGYITQNQKWVDKQEEVLSAQRASKRYGQPGEVYPYLGKDYTLAYEDTPKKRPTLRISGEQLLCSGHDLEAKTVIKAIDAWYRARAKEIIIDRVEYYAQGYGFNPKQVRIKHLTSRWGSCSTLGNLNFSWTLMCFDLDVIDYVVVHELCHLKQMNHSKKFWSLVEAIVPDYNRHRVFLKQNQFQVPTLCTP